MTALAGLNVTDTVAPIAMVAVEHWPGVRASCCTVELAVDAVAAPVPTLALLLPVPLTLILLCAKLQPATTAAAVGGCCCCVLLGVELTILLT